MSKGYSGLFNGTMGTTYINKSSDNVKYADRDIDIPNNVKDYLSKLKSKGDYISGSIGSFSMTDVSIMSKETGVEFAKVTIKGKTYLIRGDKQGTVIPNSLLLKIQKYSGTLDFHSHPHNDDCIPSMADRKVMAKLGKITGQKTSKIVTPNGIISTFNKSGVVSKETVRNTIDEEHKEIFRILFGGKND